MGKNKLVTGFAASNQLAGLFQIFITISFYLALVNH